MMAAAFRTGPGAHASDAELVRLLDGAAEADERSRVEAHTVECRQCAVRMERHRRRSSGLSLLLAESDPAEALERRSAALSSSLVLAPSQRRVLVVPRYLRAAAVLAGFIALGWTVRPVRAWIVARWTAFTRPVPTAAREPAPMLSHAAAPATSAAVAFVPGSADFVIAFDARPAAGRLDLRVVAGDRLTATAMGSPADFLVLPGELRIQNTRASAADYAVSVPARLVRLRVRVAAATVLDVAPKSGSEAWTIELARPGSGH